MGNSGSKANEEKTKEERIMEKRAKQEAENQARAEAAERLKNPINTETNKDWATDEDKKELMKDELTNADDIIKAQNVAGQKAAEKRSEELFRKTKPKPEPLEIEKGLTKEEEEKKMRQDTIATMVGGRRRKRTRRRKKKSKKKKNKKSKKRRKRRRKRTKKKRRRRKSRK